MHHQQSIVRRYQSSSYRNFTLFPILGFILRGCSFIGVHQQLGEMPIYHSLKAFQRIRLHVQQTILLYRSLFCLHICALMACAMAMYLSTLMHMMSSTQL